MLDCHLSDLHLDFCLRPREDPRGKDDDRELKKAENWTNERMKEGFLYSEAKDLTTKAHYGKFYVKFRHC